VAKKKDTVPNKIKTVHTSNHSEKPHVAKTGGASQGTYTDGELVITKHPGSVEVHEAGK
jgi:hypothetical protein